MRGGWVALSLPVCIVRSYDKSGSSVAWGRGPPRRKYGEHMMMLVQGWDICRDLVLTITVRAQDGMKDWCALLRRRKTISGVLTSPEVDSSGLMRRSELGLLPIRWI